MGGARPCPRALEHLNVVNLGMSLYPCTPFRPAYIVKPGVSPSTVKASKCFPSEFTSMLGGYVSQSQVLTDERVHG
eukprot:1515323-Amphidinium_carterae.1